MTDAIALLISFIAGSGAFAAGCVVTAYLIERANPLSKNIKELQRIGNEINTINKPGRLIEDPSAQGVSIPRPKKPTKTGPVTRPDAEMLDKREHPKQAEEDEEMIKAFDSLVNSPNNTMQMST